MPRKKREIRRDYLQAGFSERKGIARVQRSQQP